LLAACRTVNVGTQAVEAVTLRVPARGVDVMMLLFAAALRYPLRSSRFAAVTGGWLLATGCSSGLFHSAIPAFSCHRL